MQTALSTKPLPDAVSELKQQCGNCQPRVVIFFASTKYDPSGLSAQMQAAFPDACVMGCSTAGEIAGGKMMTGSVVATFLDESILEDAALAVIENLQDDPNVRDAFAEFERYFRMPISSLDLKKTAGLILVDGLSGTEERLMEKIGDRTDLFFIGGSAGDDLKFQGTHVLAKGRAYSNAAVLAMLRLKKSFDIIKTQSFKATSKRLVATKVDEPHRTVMEFDGKPAVQAYAEALGVSPEQVPSHFVNHPLGLMITNDPFVRSPRKVEGGSLVFYCNVKEGMVLHILEPTDIVADTRAAVEAIKCAGGKVTGLIDFECILRALQLREEKRCDAYSSIFTGIPAIGFSTYGEQYLGHINQTSTMLLFH